MLITKLFVAQKLPQNTNCEIFNFKIEDFKVSKKDTLVLQEIVFNEIGDKLLKVKPKNNHRNIEVYYTRIETLNDWGNTKNNEGIIPKWKGNAPFIKLKVTNEFFYRIPTTDYENVRESTAQKLNLKRAPNWKDVGEGWWIPRYIYRGLIVPYEIESIILKIVTTDSNNEIKTEYIKIKLSYGC